MFQILKGIFHSLCNERGEVPAGSTQDNAQQGNLDNQGGQAGQQPNQDAQQQIDWENDANPYRKRYSDSQSQIQPLVRTLSQFAEYDHQARTWKPKTQQAPAQIQPVSDDEIERLLSGYDPEFRQALSKIVVPLKTELSELKKNREQSVFMTEYNSQVSTARNKSLEEFGDEFEFAKNGKFNPDSPLYKLADQILVNKYAQFNPDGTFHKYSTPEAEYLATVEAYAIISKRSKQPLVNKGKLGAIQGQGSKSAGVRRNLPFEEYQKLSDAEKDAYDLSQIGG